MGCRYHICETTRPLGFLAVLISTVGRCQPGQADKLVRWMLGLLVTCSRRYSVASAYFTVHYLAIMSLGVLIASACRECNCHCLECTIIGDVIIHCLSVCLQMYGPYIWVVCVPGFTDSRHLCVLECTVDQHTTCHLAGTFPLSLTLTYINLLTS